jgi:chromatin remodeling complex protein RSC6
LLGLNDSALTDDLNQKVCEEFLLKQQPITNLFGILVCEEWRKENGFRLYEVEPQSNDTDSAVVRAWEWTPGRDVNPVDGAVVGQRRFSLKSKYLRQINIQERSWYPVRVLQHAIAIKCKAKSFLNIFDEIESVRQAFDKLSGLSYAVLDDTLTYQEMEPCVSLPSEINGEACSSLLPETGDFDGNIETSEDEKPLIPTKSPSSWSDSDSDSASSDLDMESGNRSAKAGEIETETESEASALSDSISDDDVADLLLSNPSQSSQMNVYEPEADSKQHCKDICTFGRKWNGQIYNIQCSVCKQWFHGECVGVKKGHVGKKDIWVCSVECEDDLPLCGRISTVICGATIQSRRKRSKSKSIKPEKVKSAARSVSVKAQTKVSASSKTSAAMAKQPCRNSRAIEAKIQRLKSEKKVIVSDKITQRLVEKQDLFCHDMCNYDRLCSEQTLKVQCESCKVMFHGECVGLEAPIMSNEQWVCSIGCKELLSSDVTKNVVVRNNANKTAINHAAGILRADAVCSSDFSCICGDRGDTADSRFMIKCSICNGQFHGDCVGVIAESVQGMQLSTWICSEKCRGRRRVSPSLQTTEERELLHDSVAMVVEAGFSDHDAPKVPQFSTQLYCTEKCKYGREEGDDFMIECCSCLQWFHGECVDVLEGSVPAEAVWVCCMECEEEIPITARTDRIIIGATRRIKASKSSKSLQKGFKRESTEEMRTSTLRAKSGSDEDSRVAPGSGGQLIADDDCPKMKSIDEMLPKSEQKSSSEPTVELSTPSPVLCLPKVLSAIIGLRFATRPEVMHSVLSYVMENELLDTEDPAYINVDAKLKEIVGVDARCKLSRLAKKVTKLLKSAPVKGEGSPEGSGQEDSLEMSDEISTSQMKRRLDLSFQDVPLHQIQERDLLSTESLPEESTAEFMTVMASDVSISGLQLDLPESSMCVELSKQGEIDGHSNCMSTGITSDEVPLKRKCPLQETNLVVERTDQQKILEPPTKRQCIITALLSADHPATDQAKTDTTYPSSTTNEGCSRDVQALPACAPVQKSEKSVPAEDDLDEDDLRLLEVHLLILIDVN